MRQKRNKDDKPLDPNAADIKSQIPARQLAAIAAMALAFNETEASVERLFFAVTMLPDNLQQEVATRINGIDGRIAIINTGAQNFLDKTECAALANSLGDNWFGKMKTYRDCVIHVRSLNPLTGIGVKVDRRGGAFNVLVQETALNTAYDIIKALRFEFDQISKILNKTRIVRLLADDDPKKASLEAEIANDHAQLQQYRTERSALRPMPEFPSESELRELENQRHRAHQEEQWDEFRRYHQGYPPWHHHSYISPALWMSLANAGGTSPPPESTEEK